MKQIRCIIQLLLCSTGLMAQTDTLAPLRSFVQLSKVYQQWPLYLEMELTNSTNFVTGEEDTAHMKALFYIQPAVSYMRFGDTEQLVSDSMTLLVSDKLQRMILYSQAQPVLQQMQLISGLQTSDSSLLELSKRFTGKYEQSAIVLSSRNLLPGTSLPKESVELQYKPNTKEPLQVITIKRNLLPLSPEDYELMKNQAKLVTIEGRGQFLIKEQVGTFAFKKIMHDGRLPLPATISDRLTKDTEGRFVPVKAYETYAVTIN